MSATSEEANNTPLVRIKLPWPFILSSFGALALFLIVLWSSVNRLTDEVRELKGAVQAGNSIMITLQNDVSLLKYRQDAMERTFREHESKPPR